MKRGDLLVPMDRNPLEMYLLGLCVLAGLANGYVLALTGRSDDHVPPLIGWAFAVLLVAGGLGGIAGAFWPDAISGVLIVRAAMIPTSAGAMAYAVEVLRGGGGWVAALSTAGFAVACGWRAADITSHVRDQRRARIILSPAPAPTATELPDGGELS